MGRGHAHLEGVEHKQQRQQGTHTTLQYVHTDHMIGLQLTPDKPASANPTPAPRHPSAPAFMSPSPRHARFVTPVASITTPHPSLPIRRPAPPPVRCPVGFRGSPGNVPVTAARAAPLPRDRNKARTTSVPAPPRREHRRVVQLVPQD